MRFVRALVGALASLWTIAACSGVASAHPLGNFTINHMVKVRLIADHRIAVRYVLDMAEIPTFQIMRDRGITNDFTQAQLQAWSADELNIVRPLINIEADGVPLDLQGVTRTAMTRPGAGGLKLLYLSANFAADVPASAHRLSVRDATFPDRLGWKDIVIAPQTEPTNELRLYPSALIGSPRHLSFEEATLDVHGLTPIAQDPNAAITTAPTVSAARSNTLSDMLSKGTGNFAFVLLTLIAAVGLGALHAIEPGHGKTLLAISLVGARATVKQAAILAGALTVAHTAGVVALGAVLLVFSRYLVPEMVYPWITLLSGVAVAYIGARALANFLQRTYGVEHAHTHEHDRAHPHAHDHVHDETHGHHHHEAEHHQHDDGLDHAHSHGVPAGTKPLHFGAVVIAAMSGGVAPCPAALVVLLTALTLHQVAYGMIIIVAFSFGLAGVLTGLGIAVVRGAAWITQRPALDRLMRYGPLASACVITLIGSIMVGRGMSETLVRAPWFIVSALLLLAIAGYAITPKHQHAAQTA